MRSTHLINYILFALIATILIAVSPVSALVAADGKDIQSHPHSPSSNSIPPEEVDALTNGERFRRYVTLSLYALTIADYVCEVGSLLPHRLALRADPSVVFIVEFPSPVAVRSRISLPLGILTGPSEQLPFDVALSHPQASSAFPRPFPTVNPRITSRLSPLSIMYLFVIGVIWKYALYALPTQVDAQVRIRTAQKDVHYDCPRKWADKVGREGTNEATVYKVCYLNIGGSRVDDAVDER